MANLRGYLTNLHELISGDQTKLCAEQVHSIVSDIGRTVLSEVRDNETAICCALLFDEHFGILSFLRKTVLVHKYELAKSETLDFLESFIDRARAAITPYAVEIKDVCVSLLRDQSTKVKKVTFPLLMKLLRVTSNEANLGQKLQISAMIDKYFCQLAQATKHTATVKQGIYALLGTIAQFYPEMFLHHSDRILDIYMAELKRQMTCSDKKAEMAIIVGCFQGLTGLLVNFTQPAEEGSANSHAIFKYSLSAIDPANSTSRYDVTKAALTLLTKHGDQFGPYVMEKYQMIYTRLSYWSTHNNYDMSNFGTKALDTFYKVVARRLVAEDTKDMVAFRFFITEFNEIMDDNTTYTKQLSVAIKGYGQFAAPCRVYLSVDDVTYMMTRLLRRSQQLFFTQDGVNDDRIGYLPSFVDALASIVQEMDEISESSLHSLEKLVVIVVENYVRFQARRKLGVVAVEAIVHVLLALASKRTVLQAFLANVVYQGMIRTCSRPVHVDRGQDDVTAIAEKRETLRDFLPMWYHLLDVDVSDVHKPIAVRGRRPALARAVYDQVVVASMKILEKLDLVASRDIDVQVSADEVSSLPASADPVSGLSAVKPSDYIIFINLVEFCREVFLHRHEDKFTKWMYVFGRTIIEHSTSRPLVSGFYKLMAVCAHIASDTAYFQHLDRVLECSDVDSMTAEEVDDLGAEKEACFLLFSKFTVEVLARMKQFKDDLFGACVVFILSLPVAIIRAHLQKAVDTLKAALKVGQSYLPLASAALGALEQWSVRLPGHLIEPHYPVVLPCLDAYLRTEQADLETSTLIVSSSAQKLRGRKKIPLKLLKPKSDAVIASVPELTLIKHRIVALLARLGGGQNHHLISTASDDIAKLAVAWDNKKHLKFEVPFQDIKPTIYFDPFLPRVAELALHSSERQTKVAACELLHSLVLYMLGRGAFQPEHERRRLPMHRLYNRLFPTLLKLACDVEQVTRQLFEPLVMQLIHWFTGSKKFESDDTAELLNAIQEGIVQPSDTGLRDFCAKCINEFLQWSIKQTSKQVQEKSPINAKALLKRLYSLAVHPCAFRRLGAALAFNNIYTVLREEHSLVDTFVFEILVVYVDSLALAHTDEKSLGTQEQCRQVLKHLERIIQHTAPTLNADSKTRRKPRDWNKATLDIAVRWLIRQCGRPQTECRHVCMELVSSLAVHIKGVKHPRDLFAALWQKEGAEYFLTRFEGGGFVSSADHGSLAKFPALSDVMSSVGFTVTVACQWFDWFLAALDCYTWAFGQGLLLPSQLLSGDTGTCIWRALDFFLNRLSMEEVESAALLLDKHPGNLAPVFTPRERADYNRVKCTVIVRVFNFLVVLLETNPADSSKVAPVGLFSEELWQVVFLSCIAPSTLGFNMADVETMDKLPEEVVRLLQVMKRRLPEKTYLSFQCHVDGQIRTKSCFNLWQSLEQSDLGYSLCNESLRLMNLTRGFISLQRVGLLSTGKTGVDILHVLVRCLYRERDGQKEVVVLSPAAVRVANDILNLSFLRGLQVSDFMDVLTNDDVVVDETGDSTVVCRLGVLFCATFSHSVNKHMVNVVGDLVPLLFRLVHTKNRLVVCVLSCLLDQLVNDRQTRKKDGAAVVSCIVGHWSRLEPWWRGDDGQLKSALLDMFNKLLLIDAKSVFDREKGWIPTLVDMYSHLLTDRKSGLMLKNQALDVLYFFTDLPAEHVNKIKESLDEMVSVHFPLRSVEFSAGTSLYMEYVAAFNKLLDALQLSGSSMLLELLISIMCREDEHILESTIQAKLSKFIRRMSPDKQTTSLDVAYGIVVGASYNDDIRRATCRRVLLPMLRHVAPLALTQFFLAHVTQIVNAVQSEAIKEPNLASKLITKTCNLQMVELLYSNLSKDDLNSKDSRINRQFCVGKSDCAGNELTVALTKACHGAKKETVWSGDGLDELRRRYQCAAYNALAAMVTCTKTDKSESKFYDVFLFSENRNKGEYLLDNLVDRSVVYEFPLELENASDRKKKFVTMRRSLRDSSSEADDESSLDEETRLGPMYISSQYLIDSSLSEEISQFDRLTATESFVARGARATATNVPPRTVEISISRSRDVIEMDVDSLNQHECMVTLVTVVHQIFTMGICADDATMPNWMQYLRGKFLDPNSHLNVRLFIARLVVNCARMFQPFSRFWLDPLVQFVVCGENGGAGIHAMVVDIVVTVLSWTPAYTPEDTVEGRMLAQRLLEFIMDNCYHTTRAIFRNNLEMVKLLVESWKGLLVVPVKIIHQYLADKTDEKRCQTGVQLLGVMVSNKLPAYTASPGLDEDKYFQRLVDAMNDRSKPAYCAAAEVVGMVLSEQSGRGMVTSLSANVHSVLANQAASNTVTFLHCLHKIRIHHPPTVDKFIPKLLFLLPNLHGDLKTICLEIILSRVDAIEEGYTELKSRGLQDLITHRDEGTQLVALKIVQKLLRQLKSNEMLQLLPAITNIGLTPSGACRTIMYRILMWVYDNYRESESEESASIMTQTKESLLVGLSDEDLTIRLTVQNFWSHETRLPQGTCERLVAMLEAMYSPSTEAQYLAYSTNLLLEMTSKSPDYNREIFEHPLSECKFQEYKVQSSWKQRHTIMTPMFADTMLSQSQQGAAGDMASSVMGGQIRATQQQQEFTPTQSDGGQAYNWLTQSNVNTFSDVTMSLDETDVGSLPSSLLFTVGSRHVTSRDGSAPARPGVPTDFGHKRLSSAHSTKASPADDNAVVLRSDAVNLHRRFVKDKQSDRRYFAKRAARVRDQRQASMKERLAQREHQVTIYRQYRIGDLPDIQIKYSYLIAPLQALAQKDSTVARLLFTAVFSAIIAEAVKLRDESGDHSATLVQTVSGCVGHMLDTSIHYFPPFIASLLTISHTFASQIILDPAVINMAAIASCQQPLGIMLLEEQLLVQSFAAEPKTKRSRHPEEKTASVQVSKETSVWIELARIYKSLRDYDVLHGVFSGLSGTKTVTQEALQAESRGDYSAAVKLYNQAIGCADWSDGDPLDVEVDLWDESRLMCYNQLGQWRHLNDVSERPLLLDGGDLMNVWQDTYYQDRYLPYVVRSKLKLLLQGADAGRDLMEFVSKSMKEKIRQDILENQFSEELAMMYLWENDYDRARHYIYNARQIFLMDWVNLDVLLVENRAHRLHSVQKCGEMIEFLDLVRKQGSCQAETGLDQFADRLPHRLLDKCDVWDDVITNRCTYMDRLLAHHDHQANTKVAVDHQKLTVRLAQAYSAAYQNNFTLALKLLKSECSDAWSHGDADMKLNWLHCYASTHVHDQVKAPPDRLNTLHGTYIKLKSMETCQARASLLGDHQIMMSQTIRSLTQCILAMDHGTIDVSLRDKLSALFGPMPTMDINKIVAGMTRLGYDHLIKARDCVSERVSDDQRQTLVRAHLELFTYCDDVLRRQEDGDNGDGVHTEVASAYPETVIKSLMAALKLDYARAQTRFPRLLQIVEYYPATLDMFIDMTSHVPCWMMIGWIGQMVALLDKPEARAVHAILEKIADDYPQALVYPFRITSESLKFDSSKFGILNKSAVDRIRSVLASQTLVDKFISSLEQFSQPNSTFKEWTDSVVKVMSESGRRRQTELESLLDELRREMLDIRTNDSQGDLYDIQSVDMGPYRKRFAQLVMNDINKVFGNDGRKLLTMSVNDFVKQTGPIKDKMTQAVSGTLAPPGLLKDYSPWLDTFSANNYDKQIEVPGQYTGLSKPMPEYHAKIAGFDKNVKVMTSIRKPKRVTIRGHDERDYLFLVKDGEDLRQDQRIEQLFSIMNDIYRRDPSCSQRKLALRTYQVVPMTTRIGLIEWVKHTVPLKHFMMDAYTESEVKRYGSDNAILKTEYCKNIAKFANCKNKSPALDYPLMFMKASKDDVVRKFTELQNQIDWDILRRAFLHLSNSPEAFFTLRSHFVRSYAVTCSSQYLLGIGDRHLSNILLDTDTGAVLGIDFGHAFGSAIQLPVPELMPFRLTRQMENLMLPLRHKGQFEHVMAHALRALRHDHDMLLTVMDVFVKDQSLDWQQFADRQLRETGVTEESRADIDWFPKQKIRFAKRKLNGENPSHITRDELKLGHARKPALNDYIKVVLGAADSVRCRLAGATLTPEQQVTCLIEQATDPDILGRTWVGWESYF